MEDKKIFNLNTLVSVYIKDKRKCRDIIYRPFKKSFFGNYKEGFYYKNNIYLDSDYIPTEDIRNATIRGYFNGVKLMIEENTVYYKPYVQLSFMNGEKSKCIEFDSYGEALKWANEQANKGMSIKIEL